MTNGGGRSAPAIISYQGFWIYKLNFSRLDGSTIPNLKLLDLTPTYNLNMAKKRIAELRRIVSLRSIFGKIKEKPAEYQPENVDQHSRFKFKQHDIAFYQPTFFKIFQPDTRGSAGCKSGQRGQNQQGNCRAAVYLKKYRLIPPLQYSPKARIEK
jgi:hypothetical protein